jgi:hypothetical protein
MNEKAFSEFWKGLSELEKIEFRINMDKALDAMGEAAKKQLRQKDLLVFEAKWKNVRSPKGIEDKSRNIAKPLINSIGDMWWKAGLRMEQSAWENLGAQMVAIVGPPMVRCYYLGYEMAAGNVRREDGNDYLLAAIDPIENFVIEVTGTLMESGKVSEEVGKNLVDAIVAQAITAGNEHIILGINNYHKVGK